MRRIKWVILSMLMILIIFTGCAGESDKVNNEEVLTEKGIDLEGTYNQNDLAITTIEKKTGNIVAEIPQIKGLINQEIQEKINQNIYEQVTEACSEVRGLNFVNYTTMSNFSNVISISVYFGSDDIYDQIHLNYNLINGEKLSFDELFCEDTDTIEIVREAFYETLVLNQMNGNINENELYKIVKSFNESDHKEFSFTASKIYLYCKEYVASVKMKEIADKVAIYSRYLTDEQLYDGEYSGRKNIMTCVDIPEEAFDLMKFGLINDNCWFDITSLKEYIGDEFPKEKHMKYLEFKKDRYSECFEEIKRYADDAKKNPDKFYIVLSKPSFYLMTDSEWNGIEWIENYGETVEMNMNFSVFEMPLKLYEEIYKEKLLEAYRYEYLALAGGIYLEATEDEVQVEEQYIQKTYNYMTGEEVNR